jgi:hypothetical protein
MPIWLQIAGAVWIILQGTITVWSGFFRTKSGATTDLELEKRFSELKQVREHRFSELELKLERRFGEIETSIQVQKVLQGNLEKLMAQLLHSPHTPELDDMLAKVISGEMTECEAPQTIAALRQVYNNQKESSGRRVIAAVLIASINARYCPLKGGENTDAPGN